MKRISIFLTEKQIKFLTGIGKDTGLPMAEHIRRAIDNYIKEIVKEYGTHYPKKRN